MSAVVPRLLPTWRVASASPRASRVERVSASRRGRAAHARADRPKALLRQVIPLLTKANAASFFFPHFRRLRPRRPHRLAPTRTHSRTDSRTRTHAPPIGRGLGHSAPAARYYHEVMCLTYTEFSRGTAHPRLPRYTLPTAFATTLPTIHSLPDNSYNATTHSLQHHYNLTLATKQSLVRYDSLSTTHPLQDNCYHIPTTHYHHATIHSLPNNSYHATRHSLPHTHYQTVATTSLPHTHYQNTATTYPLPRLPSRPATTAPLPVLSDQ